MTTRMKFIGYCLALMAMGRVTYADRTQEVIESAQKASAEWKSFTCAFTSENDGPTTGGKSVGILKYLQPNYVRIETTLNDPVSGETKTVYVTDGKTVFTETSDPKGGQPIIFKTERPTVPEPTADLGDMLTPVRMLESFQKMYDLKVDEKATGETIQDMRMIVLGGNIKPLTPEEQEKERQEDQRAHKLKRPRKVTRNNMAGLIGSIRVWLGEQDYFPHRIQLIPPNGTEGQLRTRAMVYRMPKITTTYYDVKFNPPLKPEDFIYIVPDGAQVQVIEAPKYD